MQDFRVSDSERSKQVKAKPQNDWRVCDKYCSVAVSLAQNFQDLTQQIYSADFNNYHHRFELYLSPELIQLENLF